jgi:uncharacterized protein YoxC
MAEVEVGGVKFKGGKLVVIFTLISTLGGGLWAGFEFYKDYMDMREKIESYTAPDLSGFDKKIALLRKTMKEVRREMGSVRTRVGEIQTVVRDIREDTRSDAGKLFGGISSVDKRSRALDSETRDVVRRAEKNIRSITSKNEKNIRDIVESSSTRLDLKINSANTRFDAKITQVDSKLDALERRLNKQLKRALDNPILRKK